MRIALPEMQRKYIWSSKQVTELLDSIYRKYPTGSILLWELPTARVSKFVSPAFEQKQQAPGKVFLIDGQQRLTSLVAVIKGVPVEVKGRKTKIEIMFNLDHPAEVENEDDKNAAPIAGKESLEKDTFAVKKTGLGKNWVSVSWALRATVSELSAKFSENQKYLERISKLKEIEKYQYEVITIEEKSYAEVVNIFLRVNSRGAKIKGSDLALALITAIWPRTEKDKGAREALEAYQDACKKKKHDIEMGIIVRNLVAFATNRVDFTRLHNKNELKENWEDSKKGMDAAIDFIINDVGLESLGLLSHPTCLVTVAKSLHAKKFNASREHKEKLKFWILMANLKGRYSRASLSVLAQDIQNASDVRALITNLRLLARRLRIEADDLREEDRKTSIFFKFLYIMLRNEKAKDWCGGSPISWSSISQGNKLEFHHIFPKSKLKGRSRKDINNIANMACLSRKTNAKLKDKLPEVYLPDIDSKLLKQHLIPTDRNLWKMENYLDFLKERRQMIADEMNRFLKIEEIEASLKE